MKSSSNDNTSDRHLAAAILSKRYEDQLLKQGAGHNRVVPALVITGFLGAGKTTLLQHLLATAGTTLKLGVLVNEVAQLDVDSQLLNSSNSNAAAGIKATQLSGGCACCAVYDDLKAALDELTSSSNYQHLDYLLLETSGVADAEPLAASLSAAGFRLTGVVAVVDAEAGPQVMQERVAQAQLRAADIVVLNKCDLASLGAVSDVEDQVQQLTPGVRMLRARYGQVPAEAFLDLDVADYAANDQEGADTTTAAAAGACAQGEIAFLSHEPIVSTAKFAPRRGASLVRRRVSPGQSPAHDNSHHDHNSFGSCSFTSAEPLCMACFQSFVAQQLVPSTGLFRAKGFVWFQQQRDKRYVFHLSGKQRVECGCEGPWLGPPGVQLVMIGHQREALQHLQQGLQQCAISRCQCSLCSLTKTDENGVMTTCSDLDTYIEQGPMISMIRPSLHLTQLIEKHPRFQVITPKWAEPALQASPNSSQDAAQKQDLASAVITFTAVGSPLHGVVSDEVNAAVLRKLNATPGVFLCHIKSHASLRSTSGQVACQGVTDIQVGLSAATSFKEMEAWWTKIQTVVDPLLKKLYQHVHNCKCDVAAVAAYDV